MRNRSLFIYQSLNPKRYLYTKVTFGFKYIMNNLVTIDNGGAILVIIPEPKMFKPRSHCPGLRCRFIRDEP